MAESVWKTKPHIHLTIWSNNQDSRHLPKGYESICLHKHLYKHSVYISFIHNWWNLEAIKMIFSRWMNNQTVVHLHIEIKRNELSSPEKTWRKLKCIILSERSQSEKPTNHIIPNRGPSGKGGTMRTVKRQMVSREKAGKEGGWVQGLFVFSSF